MKIFVTGFRYSFALLASATLLGSPAWANAYLQKGKLVTVANSAMTVTPTRDWNELSIKPGKKAETWTLDGEQLNDVTWFGGIAPGEALLRERSKKRKPLPKFTGETLLVEIPELLEVTYRSEKEIASFGLTGSSPDRFLGHDGIRFTYEYIDKDNLPRKGEGLGTLVKGKLYMVTFDAPRLHYFDASLGDFHALSDSAALM
jgi:hypothetical protein